MIKKLLFLFLIISMFSSCVPKKKLIYFQGIENLQNGDSKERYEPRFQPDDLLLIIVSATDPEAAAPYNLGAYSSADSDKTSGASRYQTYLVDSNGNIEFPVLGTIKLGGLTRTETVAKLKNELKKYILDPIINIRIINYKYSVMGEVARPGLYNLATERLTLPEALSSAGDLTIYGNRKSILVIRDIDGVKTSQFVDITKTDFINSPFYYLHQNDVIYVNPNRTKINSSAVGPNITVGISVVSLLITVVTLLTR